MSRPGPELLGPVPHVFAEDLDAPQPTDEDRHHLERVLRVRVGDAITVSDGAGRWRRCRMGTPMEPVGPVESVAAPEPPITLCFALVKGERPELVVQKLTELGVDRVVPFVADRSVVRWDPSKGTKEVVRLRAVARNAAMQSRRSWLPVVEDIATFDEVAARPGAARADVHGHPPSLATPVVLVGPEGGWSDRERAVALPAVVLGDHVLRSETAALVAGALLTALRGGLVTRS